MKTQPLFLLLLLSVSMLAQNLVKNPSFEAYISCPKALGTFSNDLEHWSTPTDGTTDYFNSCSEVMPVPKNFNGEQEAKFGNAYAGIYFYAPADYREYIQVPLKRTLKKGTNYEVSFYLSLAEDSDFAVREFDVLFSYKKIEIPTKKPLSKGKLFKVEGNKFHEFKVHHDEFFTNKRKWFKATVSFNAKGFERFLIIGNLKPNKLTKKQALTRGKAKQGAYYYIDMVSVITPPSSDAIEDDYELNKTYVFKNIYFDFDRYDLDAVAEESLERMHNYLVKNPNYHIAIRGHTDNKGSNVYNEKLSYNRAKTIAEFLIAMGIDSGRVSFTNHGSMFPIADNTSEDGRKKNRRAEFVIQN